MFTPVQIINRYIAAKDGNRPALFDACFTKTAALNIVSNTDAVSFPGQLSGRQEIAKHIARDFARRYENVYTLCISQRPANGATEFSCPWIVAMTVKDDGSGRLGWGQYDWRFDLQQQGLCSELTIRIADMLVIRPPKAPVLPQWADRLDYPWCNARQAMNPPLNLSGTESFQQWLGNLQNQNQDQRENG